MPPTRNGRRGPWNRDARSAGAAVSIAVITAYFGRSAFVGWSQISSPARLRCPEHLLRAVADKELLPSLEQWVDKQGATSTVRFAELPGFGFSLVAGEEGVKAGQTLLRIPSTLHISPSSVLNSPIGEAVGGMDDDSALLALGLLAEVAKGEESSFLPYLRILPGWDDMQVPLLWPEEQRTQLLRGSHLLLVTEQFTGMLKEQWGYIWEALKDKPDLFPAETFNERNWMWAHAICLTRGLPFGNALSLIPALDLANHKLGSNNTCSIGVPAEDGSVTEINEMNEMKDDKVPEAVLTAGRDFAPGEQIFIDYDGGVGDRLSWEMLHTYGFVPGQELPEVLAAGGRPLHFEGVAATDPLSKQKHALFEALGAGEDAAAGTWQDVRSHVNSCRAMAPLLRLAHLTPDDGKVAEDMASWRAEPKSTWAALQRPLSSRNEQKVAEQILAACSEALSGLPSSEELGEVLKSQEDDVESMRARLAAKVILGERVALEACTSVWQAVK